MLMKERLFEKGLLLLLFLLLFLAIARKSGLSCNAWLPWFVLPSFWRHLGNKGLLE